MVVNMLNTVGPQIPQTQYQNQNLNQKNNKKDLYLDTPVRYLGFTNEVGAAVAPLIGPVGEMLTYIPAFLFIGADARDKYKRGDNDDYQTPSSERASKEVIFHMLASVILPTAVVKASQLLAERSIDHMPGVKNNIKAFVDKRAGLKKLVNKFADKPLNNKSALNKFAHGFQNVVNHITVIPALVKSTPNKSGLRNIGLALVGLTTLSMIIKPIDKFVHNVILPKVVDPLLYKNKAP